MDFRSDDFYTDKYQDTSWLNQRTKDALDLVERIEGLKLFKKNNKVLDVGCGSGDLSKILIDLYGVEAHGLELNKTAIKKAKERGVNARLCDLDSKWPYSDNSFDSVVGTEIIEHVVNPDHFLKEAHRVLKKNGKLVITTPNLAAWFNRVIFLFGYHPFFLEPSTVDKTVGLKFTRNLTSNREPMGHIRCFTLRALVDIMELHNFKITLKKGSTVYYLPKYMAVFDGIFQRFPSLSTDLTIVAQKK